MTFTWVDLLSGGGGVILGGLQYLRGIRNLSQVVYESIVLLAAVALATVAFHPLHEATRLPMIPVYLALLVVPGAFGILLATVFNRRCGFSLGNVDYALALMPATVAAAGIARVVLHCFHIIGSSGQAGIAATLQRSWLAGLLLYCEPLRGVLQP